MSADLLTSALQQAQPSIDAEIRPATAAEAWFRRELAASRLRMGRAWPAHREWVADCLRYEARERFPLLLPGPCPGAAS